MSQSGRSILDAASSWHERNSANLASLGIEARLVGPTTGLSKNSASIEFISSESLVAATVWDSGEYEVITTSQRCLIASPSTSPRESERRGPKASLDLGFLRHVRVRLGASPSPRLLSASMMSPATSAAMAPRYSLILTEKRRCRRDGGLHARP